MAKKVRDIEAEIDIVQTPEQAGLTLDRIGTVKRAKVRNRLTSKLNEKFDNTVAPRVDGNKKTIETNLDNQNDKSNGSVLASAVKKTSLDNVDAQTVDEMFGADGMVETPEGLKVPSQVVLEKTGDVEKANILKFATDAVKNVKNEFEKKATESGNAIVDAVEGNNVSSTGVVEPITDEPLNGNGATINAIMSTGGINTPATMNTYGTVDDIPLNSGISTLTPEQIMAYRQAQQQYNALKDRNSYEPAIEALNVQQYFPQSDRDIRVGGYQGKNIGSISTYVARGGTLPYGIVDARRRAIRDEVKAKAALVDKIEDLNYNTAQQFNDQYIKYGQDNLESFMKAANYDTEYLNGNNELGMKFRRWKKEYENAGKDVTYIDGIVDKIEEDLKSNRFVDSDTLKLVYEWKNGKQNLDEMFSGKQNIKAFADKFKSYENVSTYIANTVERIIKSPEEAPISMKAGIELGSQEAKSAAEAMVKKSGQGYDEYISGVKKYFNTEKMEEFINSSFEHNNFFEGYSKEEFELQKKKALTELISQLPTQIVLKTDFQANDSLEIAKFNFERKKYEEGKDTPYDYIDRTVSVDLKNLIDTEYAKIEAMNIPVSEKIAKKNEARKRIYQSTANYSDNLSLITGLDVVRVPLTNVELKKNMKANYGQMAIVVTDPSNPNKKGKISLGEWSKYNDKQKAYVSKKYGIISSEIDEVIKGQEVQYKPYERGASAVSYDAQNNRYVNYNHSKSNAKTRIVDLTKAIIKETPILDKNGEKVYVDGILQTTPTYSKTTFVIDYDGSDGTVKSNMNNNYEFKKSTEGGITTESNM